MISKLAGKLAPKEILVNLEQLEKKYYQYQPNPENPAELVSFGTSGHRGSALNGTFNEAHILAITQAICDYRQAHGIDGPLYMGKDTHSLSGPAEKTALEVLAANNIIAVIQENDGFTPTPVISHAILGYNKKRQTGLADGIVITPSHNPPEDGGFKYNPTNGGPADTNVTKWIQDRANDLLRMANSEVKRVSYEEALKAVTTKLYDFVEPYVKDLINVVDMEKIRAAGVRIGIDPLGGAGVHYWQPIKELYGLDLTIVNTKVDPTFRFMTVDHDGKIRMDCSSPYAMASLVNMKNQFDIACGNDTDSDRHGIVTPSIGLMNPNYYLAVAINYLLQNRPKWNKNTAVGKTVVSSCLIDRVVADLKHKLMEVPVGFKWFAPGLVDGSICFGGEESAGASFLRLDGTVWTTDKDGIIMDLLAAEIKAQTGKDPGEHYLELTKKFGTSFYTRIDIPASANIRTALGKLTPAEITVAEIAGESITSKITNAPGNNAAIGGIKISTTNGWFAVRPSGTEDIYKIYAESLKSAAHLQQIVGDAQQLINEELKGM